MNTPRPLSLPITIGIAALLFFGASTFAQGPKLNALATEAPALAWGWQGETMLTANLDGHVRWWTADGICRDSFAFDLHFRANWQAVFTRNCVFLLAQNSDSSIVVWDVPARVRIWEKAVGGHGIRALAISENNQFWAAAWPSGMVVFDSLGQQVARFENVVAPTSIAVSNYGLVMASYPKGQNAAALKIWGLDQNGQRQTEANATNWVADLPDEAPAKAGEPPAAPTSQDQTDRMAEAASPPEAFALQNPAERQAMASRPQAEQAAPTDPAPAAKILRRTSNFLVFVGTFDRMVNARRRLADAQSWGQTEARIEALNGKFSVVAAELPTHEEAWKLKKILEERYGIHAAVLRRK